MTRRPLIAFSLAVAALAVAAAGCAKKVTEVDASGRVTFHDADEMELSPSSFYFVNPGSVGHPRKSDYRSRYGIYDADPKKHPGAVRFDSLTYIEVLNRKLAVMDATAISLCIDNDLPILVFNVMRPGNIRQAVCGARIGTLVHGGDA